MLNATKPPPCALKICKATRTGYVLDRFRQEIEFQQKVHGEEGLLPLLDSRCPDNPSIGSPAWLSMPPAITIQEKLGGQPALGKVLDAVLALASALANLHDNHNAAHRDIKPANLFWLDGKWVLGDFGLVDFPENGELTDPSRSLGPRFFMADEMIQSAGDADGKPADVFSLAKTLHVLATGMNFPPQGPHRIEELGTRISTFIPEANLRLDMLLQRATTRDANTRISMSEFRDELARYIGEKTEPEKPDLRLGNIIAAIDAIRATSSAKRSGREAINQLLSDAFHEILRRMTMEDLSQIPSDKLHRSGEQNTGGAPSNSWAASKICLSGFGSWSNTMRFQIEPRADEPIVEYVVLVQAIDESTAQFDACWMLSKGQRLTLRDAQTVQRAIGSEALIEEAAKIVASQLSEATKTIMDLFALDE